ncbi:hypothetical protein [Steroidobacter cummioxidans]|uniref:hypothetical protein n=1 Tax=Steroidobacter cummioxidans TaxID=1803913 RepID=UPI000E31AB9A|nr:hypothetical protein [Steroidobacter cummioxidans]
MPDNARPRDYGYEQKSGRCILITVHANAYLVARGSTQPFIEVLTQTWRSDEAAELNREAAVLAQGEWRKGEVIQLKAFLHGRTARSWQHADECVMHLAAQLHRDPASIRDKATELGLGVAVDCRFARQFNLGREE